MSEPIFGASLRLGLSRITNKRALFIGAGLLALVSAIALVEKRFELMGSATRTLQGGTFSLFIPLSTFAIASAILQQQRLDVAATPLARFGASRRQVALGLIASAVLGATLLSASIAGLAALLAHDPWAPPLLHDFLSSTWIGALTGAAYATLFLFGSTFGARGGGRNVALIVDFMLGGSLGVVATLTPRAHALNLLGAPPPIETMSQSASTALLLVMIAASASSAISRCPR